MKDIFMNVMGHGGKIILYKVALLVLRWAECPNKSINENVHYSCCWIAHILLFSPTERFKMFSHHPL